MTTTDDALARALADRVATIRGAAPHDLRPMARSIATSAPRSRRRASIRWMAGVAAAAAMIGAVAVGIGLVRPTQYDALPGASAAQSVALGSHQAMSSAAASPTAGLVTGCAALGFDARRCNAIVARATRTAGSPNGIVAVAVEPPDRSGGVTLAGGGPIATVDFTLAGGVHRRVDVSCGLAGPRSSDRACSADPQIWVAGGVSRDIPCGPTPAGEGQPCASLPPDPRPATIAASRPLLRGVLDVALDHSGHYEVLAGTATIPNGAITERSATVANARPTEFWIDPYIELEVRPDRGGSPIDSYYGPRVPGPMPVHVYLVFDVVELDSGGAVLRVRDIVVR